MPLWNRPDRPVVLASRSPRRRQILAQMGFAFDVADPAVDDEASYLRPADLEPSLKELAHAKAGSVAESHPQSLVLGMDTVVVIDGRVLGKPACDRDAASMLRLLSGRTHTVYTAAALLCRGCGFAATDCAGTRVRFRQLSDDEISEYLASGDHRDKAGAYGIQDRALVFVEGVEGCFYNVVGLPVGVTIRLFEQYTSFGKGLAHG